VVKLIVVGFFSASYHITTASLSLATVINTLSQPHSSLGALTPTTQHLVFVQGSVYIYLSLIVLWFQSHNIG